MPPLKVILDTSGINALEDRGLASEPLMRGLQCGFEVILTAMSADEIISTKQPERREALLCRFSRFLAAARCLWPPHEIVRLLISAHRAHPSRFDWKVVDVRARAYEAALPRRDFDDPLCVEQRTAQFEVEDRFAKMWKDLRPHLNLILAKDPTKRPTTYRQAVEMATLPNGVLWTFGAVLYGHIAGATPTDIEIREFMDQCPPFRAACYALVMAWYSGSLRTPDGTPTANRNDLLMATYLPYCDQFITADWAQQKELAEIATESRIACEVRSFGAFELSFAVSV